MCTEKWNRVNIEYTRLCNENMTRTYTLKRRAEQQADTRRRIVEAAIELHGRVGPALTTFSMVAEQAGVQRHTLYAHFPDERSLLMACSALSLERDPLPDAAAWRTIEDREERLQVGLRAVYDWYQRNAELAACVLRDAEHHALVKEISALRYGPYYRGVSRRARRQARREAARDAASGNQLLHVADAGARERPEAGRRRCNDGRCHRGRAGLTSGYSRGISEAWTTSGNSGPPCGGLSIDNVGGRGLVRQRPHGVAELAVGEGALRYTSANSGPSRSPW